MNASLVAERYAKALFQLALEQKAEEEVYRDSLLIARACAESRELRLLFSSPVINSGKKAEIVTALFRERVHRVTLNYLLIMVRKKREAFVPAIAREVGELYKAYHNILTVKFRSPLLPDETIRQQVSAIMEKYTQSKIELQAETDEELIGGFVLNWDDKQYDASIRHEIEKLRTAIAKVNLYKKGF